MKSFEELLEESVALHGHKCAGQVLGVRMAMIGCREVGVEEPKKTKKGSKKPLKLSPLEPVPPPVEVIKAKGKKEEPEA